MPQCQFLFSAVFGFRNGNILGIGRNKIPDAYFSDTFTKSEGGTKGAAGHRPHTTARVGPLPRHRMGSGPRASTDVAPSPIYSSRCENPKTPSHISRKHPLPPPPSTLTRGVQKFSSGTLPERGIITGGLYIAMPASGVMRE